MKTEDTDSPKISLEDLIDIPVLQDLSESFSRLTEIPTAILDLTGNVLIASGWQSICTDFHRKHPVAVERCLESDTVLSGQLAKEEKHKLYKCKNGLVDIAVPIIIEEIHVGNLFIGQFFLEPPDRDFFVAQAREFGFDQTTYLEALSRVPVLPIERVQQSIDFLKNLTAIICTSGKDKLELLTLNKELEQRIEERTSDLLEEIKIRKRTEEELQESKTFLHSVFNAIQDGISVLDRDLNIVQVNRIMYQWYPHLKTSIGEKCYKVYHGQSKPCTICPVRKALKSRNMEMEEVPYRLGDGLMGTQELFAFPIVDKRGKVQGIVEYVRDISKRKRAEEQFKEEKKFSDSLIKSLPWIMYVFDRSGRFLRWNKNFETVSGYSAEEIRALSPLDFIAEEDKEHVQRSIEKVFLEGYSTIEAGFQTSNGVVIPYLFTGYKLVQERDEYLVGVGLDISQRTVAEKEKEALIDQLQETLSQVKQLSGMLPICAACKKIRDDTGYWNQIETYIRRHSEATFSHGICPDCAKKLYPDLDFWKENSE